MATLVSWLEIQEFQACLTSEDQDFASAEMHGHAGGHPVVAEGNLDTVLNDLATEIHACGATERVAALSSDHADSPSGSPVSIGMGADEAAGWLVALKPRADTGDDGSVTDRWMVDMHGITVTVVVRGNGTVYVHLDTSETPGIIPPRLVSIEVDHSGYETDIETGRR